MKIVKKSITAAALTAITVLSVSALGLAGDDDKTTPPSASMLTKEQAIEKALADHPGEVKKAYREKKRGKEVWEVKIEGDDGKKWELYYDAQSGELVKAES